MGKPSYSDWRALVDKELAGAPFDKLVQATAEGLALQPLYTEGPAPSPAACGTAASFKLCMRADDAATIANEVAGGAEAVWVSGKHPLEIPSGVHIVTELYDGTLENGAPNIVDDGVDDDTEAETDDGDADASTAWLGFDPIVATARGYFIAPGLPHMLRALVPIAENLGDGTTHPVRVSTLVFHDAGADAADELALALSSTVAYLRALVDGGIAIDRAGGMLWFQLAVGRDTFGELCKLRALRVVFEKLLAAAGARAPAPPIHAVCSSRTQSERDPWVNMLRTTTQVFAAALGGAQLITPLAFDEALGGSSPLGRRTARNTALVLRDESHLGRMIDAAGGSYYIEARTDALAREVWARFQQIERDGGIVALLTSGALHDRLAASWKTRAAAIAKRKEPVLGVSEFANLDEQLPSPIPAPSPTLPGALPRHRDAEGFEALRTRVEASPRDVALITLGPPGEHRARLGYASAVFATAGLRTREVAAEAATGALDIACLCGADERYATEAAATARALRAAGAKRVVLAGRPGALEAALREAGVATFLFVGCDVLATLTDLVGGAA